MSAPADSSIPDKVLSIDYTSFVFLNFSLLLSIIAIMEVCSENV